MPRMFRAERASAINEEYLEQRRQDTNSFIATRSVTWLSAVGLRKPTAAIQIQRSS